MLRDGGEDRREEGQHDDDQTFSVLYLELVDLLGISGE